MVKSDLDEVRRLRREAVSRLLGDHARLCAGVQALPGGGAAARHPDELNREEASRLISQLADLNPPMLILTGGDPLMRSDALDLVREATAEGLHVGLSPSATARLLNADFAEIKSAGVERISLSPRRCHARDARCVPWHSRHL